MADEKRENPILQEVDASELGQLSPGYTPYNPELQSWNRGRSLGRGGDNYQVGRSSHLPEFNELASEDLSAAARESAVHLDQYALGSMDHEKVANREQEMLQHHLHESGLHQQQKEQENVQEVAKDAIGQETTDSQKVDGREQASGKQPIDTLNKNRETKEQEVTQDKDKEFDHER